MNVAAIVGIVLGEVAILFDWGSRLFGSCVRGLWQLTWRVLLLTTAAAVPLMVVFFAAAPPARAAERWLLLGFGALGILLFLHFVFPYRWGIHRVGTEFFAPKSRPLTEGLLLQEWDVAVPDLPADLDGTELLVVSDLHCNGRKKLEGIVSCVESLRERVFDCALILGDFGERDELLDEVVSALGRLRCRAGLFCVRGNHDLEGKRGRRLPGLLEDAGIELLSNEARTLTEPPLTLLGVEMPWVGGPLPDVGAGEFLLAISHTPDNLPRLSRMGVDLVVAGHTHGGAFLLPFVGEMIVSSRYGRFLNEGFFRKGKTLMYITPGLGYWPWVLGPRGELSVITLRRGEATYEH